MNKFLERLQSGETLVADGSTGASLHKMGLQAGIPPEELVLDNPAMVLQLESAFVEAGSDIILTDTFGGTRLRMQESKYADRTAEINRLAAGLTRQAASKRAGVLVAGSIGPTGLLMRPYGPLTSETAQASFADQARALAEGGVDLLVIETMFDIDEADAAFKGARQVTDLPIVISFSYDRGMRTMMGVKPADMFSHYRELGATMIGANCGTNLDFMEKIIQEYAATGTEVPLWAKPNAGLPHLVDDETNYDVTPAQMAEYALKYVRLGARVVGGCCGSLPEHVAAIAKAVKG